MCYEIESSSHNNEIPWDLWSLNLYYRFHIPLQIILILREMNQE